MKIELSALSTDRLPDSQRRKFLAGSGALGLTGFLSGGLTFSSGALAQENPPAARCWAFRRLPLRPRMRLSWRQAIALKC